MDVCTHSKTSEFWEKIKYINIDCQYGTLTGTLQNCIFPIPCPKFVVSRLKIVCIMLHIRKKVILKYKWQY